MRILLALLLLWPAAEGVTVSGKIQAAPGTPRARIDSRYRGRDRRHLKPPPPSPAVVYLEGAPASKAEGKTLEIDHLGLQFRPRIAAVQAGTKLVMPNNDPCLHNAFTLSPGNAFDFGKTRPGGSGEKLLETKGLVRIRCQVHAHMRAYVWVCDSPYFAVAKEDGSFSIPEVPPGDYTLVAWQEGYSEIRRPLTVGEDGAELDLRFTFLQKGEAGRGAASPVGCCSAR